mmetsp:Transcript_118080/g.341385  ORF Transcript_118080/g.341385 Transcript_118080/m.341385 type:complete len:279 (+) Transcript_118080:529-1365(+)
MDGKEEARHRVAEHEDHQQVQETAHPQSADRLLALRALRCVVPATARPELAFVLAGSGAQFVCALGARRQVRQARRHGACAPTNVAQAPREDRAEEHLRRLHRPLPPQDEGRLAVRLVVFRSQHCDHDIHQVNGEHGGAQDGQPIAYRAAPHVLHLLKAIVVTEHEAPVHCDEQVAGGLVATAHDEKGYCKGCEARDHDGKHREDALESIVHSENAGAEHLAVGEEHDQLDEAQDDHSCEQCPHVGVVALQPAIRDLLALKQVLRLVQAVTAASGVRQ